MAELATEEREQSVAELLGVAEKLLLHRIIEYSEMEMEPSEQLLIATNAYKNFMEAKRIGELCG